MTVRYISPDVTVHHGAEYAIMLCRLIGTATRSLIG